jgi:hypothetical protein
MKTWAETEGTITDETYVVAICYISILEFVPLFLPSEEENA